MADDNRALTTAPLPVAETPQTQARSVTGALLSMDALSQVTPEELRAGLEPLVSGYREWLDEQDATAKGLPAHLQETAEVALWEARQAQQRLLGRAAGVAQQHGEPQRQPLPRERRVRQRRLDLAQPAAVAEHEVGQPALLVLRKAGRVHVADQVGTVAVVVMV